MDDMIQVASKVSDRKRVLVTLSVGIAVISAVSVISCYTHRASELEAIVVQADRIISEKPDNETKNYLKQAEAIDIKMSSRLHGIERDEDAIKKEKMKYLDLAQNAYINRQYTEFFIYCEKAASAGCLDAQYLLGLCYEYSCGVMRDEAKSKKCFRRAADGFNDGAKRGKPSAQYMLGLCLHRGRGLDLDKNEALKLFRKAAEKGHPRAQYRLGQYYDNPKRTWGNQEEAYYWYRKAAEQFEPRAELKLGLHYYRGVIVKKNKEEAVKWLMRSAKQGNANARALLTDIDWRHNAQNIKETLTLEIILEDFDDAWDMNTHNEFALNWLKDNQELDGSWSINKWGGEEELNTDVGLTGVCLWAFLGMGHTERAGRHKGAVKKAVAYLKSKQLADGSIGVDEKTIASGVGYYNHALAASALSEAYCMARRKDTGASAKRALDYTLSIQINSETGWGEDKKQANLLLTSLFVLQLKSAMNAKLNVTPDCFKGAKQFLETVWEMDGRFKSTVEDECSIPMTAVGTFVYHLMIDKKTTPQLSKAAEQLSISPPRWDAANNSELYYWTFNTHAMFMAWSSYKKNWCYQVRDNLSKHQIKSSDTTRHGSWEPIGTDGKRFGRAYTTAMCVLFTAPLYRYLPIY